MRKMMLSMILPLLFLLPFISDSSAQVQDDKTPFAPRGIIIGNNWNPEKRELDIVFENQDMIDLGAEGILKVQMFSEILNASGKDLTWVVEYACGLRQEVWTQKVRYDRFRTYLEKTFRRQLWDQESKKMVDVSGPCKVMLIDKQNESVPIAVKTFVIK